MDPCAFRHCVLVDCWELPRDALLCTRMYCNAVATQRSESSQTFPFPNWCALAVKVMVMISARAHQPGSNHGNHYRDYWQGTSIQCDSFYDCLGIWPIYRPHMSIVHGDIRYRCKNIYINKVPALSIQPTTLTGSYLQCLWHYRRNGMHATSFWNCRC